MLSCVEHEFVYDLGRIRSWPVIWLITLKDPEQPADPLSLITITATYSLKVSSCPNDDNSVEILFCLFLCSI